MAFALYITERDVRYLFARFFPGFFPGLNSCSSACLISLAVTDDGALDSFGISSRRLCMASNNWLA